MHLDHVPCECRHDLQPVFYMYQLEVSSENFSRPIMIP